jgi:hypothetical protein
MIFIRNITLDLSTTTDQCAGLKPDTLQTRLCYPNLTMYTLIYLSFLAKEA